MTSFGLGWRDLLALASLTIFLSALFIWANILGA